MRLITLGLLAVVSAVMAEETPMPFSHLVPKRLSNKEDANRPVQFFAQSRGYAEGGTICALPTLASSSAESMTLTAGNAGSFFEPIDTPDKALELCQLLHWGALVETREAFDKIQELLHGAEKPSAEAKARAMRFDGVARKLERDFEVAFTAFVMEHGMGAGSHVSRYRYLVTPEGKISLEGMDRYLQGPYLNWQYEADTPESEEKNERKIRETAATLAQVFALCPRRIPRGFHQETKP
mgnify:CR=1 FL=1